jgi:hypothetical protein
MLETELLSTLDEHDQMVRDCAAGQLSFQDFLGKYDNFYLVYALDGHESETNEQKLFQKYENRIAPHREVSEMLEYLCSDIDAVKDVYIQANRFGSEEAVRRLKQISKKYLES